MTRRRTPVRAAIRLPTRRRYAIYGVALGVWASGVGWLLTHWLGARKGPFGPEADPAEPVWLKVHGALAFLALVLFGLVWGVHVVNGWAVRRRRWTGGALTALTVVLMVSGYLLYYAGRDDVRGLVSIIHWAIGLGSLAAFALHRFQRETEDRTPRQRERSRKA